MSSRRSRAGGASSPTWQRRRCCTSPSCTTCSARSEQGLAHLAEKFGEQNLFVGPPRAQATSENFRWPELVPVTDLASAQKAIDTILEQGEGARGHWEDAHFGQFVRILDEYRAMMKA